MLQFRFDQSMGWQPRVPQSKPLTQIPVCGPRLEWYCSMTRRMKRRTSSGERVWSTQGSQRRRRSRFRSARLYSALASLVSRSFNSTPGATVRRNMGPPWRVSQSFGGARVARFGNRRRLVGFRLKGVSHQRLFEEFECGLRMIGVLEQIQILGRDHAVLDERIKIDDLFPVLRAVEQNSDLLGELLSLREREQFHELIHGAVTPGKDHQRFGEVGEPELAHEEVVELEAELRGDVRIRKLFEGKPDVQADGFAFGFGGAAVGGFHDARPAARADHEAVRAVGELIGPFGEHAGKFACFVIITRHRAILGNPGRTKEHDRVAHFFAPEVSERFQELSQYAQSTGIGAVQELLVEVGGGAPVVRWRWV